LETLNQALYVVTTALLLPVLVMIMILLGWAAILLGGFLREAVERRRVRRQLDAAVDKARSDAPRAEILSMLDQSRSGVAWSFCQHAQHSSKPHVLSKALEDLESDIAAALAKLSFVTRVAPMLGLMGTLIPLGPALLGLANGDMKVLSTNLVVAFTATVVGLLISGVAYGIGLARRTWYERDISDIEFVFRDVLPRNS
jgi:biopolymer transport protein ExbB/TolQ